MGDTGTKEHTLCFRCRYDLTGLPFEIPCPECGLPIEVSIWTWSTGSPWQLLRNMRSLWLSWVLLMVRPFDSALKVWLTAGNAPRLAFITSAVVALTPVVLAVPVLFRKGGEVGFYLFGVACTTGCVLWLAILAWQLMVSWSVRLALPTMTKTGPLNLAAHYAFVLLPASAGAVAGVTTFAYHMADQVINITNTPSAAYFREFWFACGAAAVLFPLVYLVVVLIAANLRQNMMMR